MHCGKSSKSCVGKNIFFAAALFMILVVTIAEATENVTVNLKTPIITGDGKREVHY